jgi:hypothetical protein
MPADIYKRTPFRFYLKGTDLVHPINLIQEGFYYIATNIRSYQDGVIQPRPGLTSVHTLAGVAGIGLHSIKRLNDPISAIFDRVEGMGSLLFADGVQISTGFSGNPLTFAIANPPRSPRPYLYIGDSTKICKHKCGGSATIGWGIPAPTIPPFKTFGAPATATISDFESGATGVGGTAAAATNPNRVSTTIARIAYDTGSTGWASVEPTVTTEINEGMFLIVGAAETSIVDMVLPAIPTTTVAAISYDSGSTGLCSIQLTGTVGKQHIRVGSLVTIGAENCVVLDVIWGDDGVPSIRVTSTGTLAAGNAVTGRSAARMYLTGTRSAGDALTSKMAQSTISVGIGWVDVTGAVDGSITSGGRPIDMEEDEFHISIQFDDLAQLTEAKIFLDVDVATNDCTQNYYFKALSPNDFVPVTKDTATVIEQRIERLQKKLLKAIQNGEFDRAEALRKRIANKQAELDEVSKTPLESQSTLGDNQWTELRFKTKELFRVGSDKSRTLKNIALLRIQVNCLDDIVLKVDACWIGGTFGPDVGDRNDGYRYIFRYRNRETGVCSAWSPPTRTPMLPHRQRITLATTASADGQTDQVDVAREGGNLSGVWKLIGSTTNGGAFNDDNHDEMIVKNLDVDLNSFQPFAITDLPKSGTCTVAGTTADITAGDAVNVDYARNSVVFIDNKLCTLYGPPLSTSKFQLNESVGSGSVSFYIPAPLLTAEPLPSIFGPIGYGEMGIYIFGVGHLYNPGTLFWCNGNDPDLMHDYNTLDVCAPSEQLISGCLYNGKAFLFSSERMFEIFPNFSSDQAAFVTQEIPNSKGMLGLLQNTAVCSGPRIWFRGKDGIYETTGGEPKNITNAQLYPLFPHDGQAGILTNGYYPPDDTKSQNLEFYDGYLYYDFTDSNGSPVCWVYSTITGSWTCDTYNAGLVPIVHYGEEGSLVHSLLVGGKTSGGTGTLWQQTGTADGAFAIACNIRTLAWDAQDIRAKKHFRDAFFDADADTETLSIIVGFDEYSSLEVAQTRSAAGRAKTPPLIIQDGEGKIAYNEALNIAWSSSTRTPKLYAWESSWIIKPEDVVSVVTDPDDAGYPGAKFLQGVEIEADTLGQDKTAIVQYDAGANGLWTNGPTITLNHAQQSIIPHSFNPYSFNPVLIGHLFRLKFPSSDTDPIRLFKTNWIWEPCPELVDYWVSQQTTHDLLGYQHLGWLQVTLLSTTDVSLVINIDGVDQAALTLASTGGLRLKRYVKVPAKKGKTYIYKLYSNTTEPTETQGFRVYQKDLEVAVKQWGSGEAYQIKQPFGEVHRIYGARI